MASGVASGHCPICRLPPNSIGWVQEKPLEARGVLGQGGGRATPGARGEGTPTAGPGKRRRCTGPVPACREAPPVSWALGARSLSDAPAPPYPRGPAGPGVSPHGAIGPTADVRRGHVGLGQLPGGLVDVLLVEALFPGEAHPANPISAAPARRLRSRSTRLPAPGPRSPPRPLPPRAADSSPAEGGAGPQSCPPAGSPRCAARPRPGLPRQRAPGASGFCQDASPAKAAAGALPCRKGCFRAECWRGG